MARVNTCIFSILLLMFCLSLTGCVKATSDVTISEEGAVHTKNTLAGIDMMQESIEKEKNDAIQKNSSAKVTSISDGNMKGYQIETKYPSLEGFAQSSGKMFGTIDGKCKGIQQKKGWLFDSYAFDLFVEGSGKDDNEADAEMKQMAQAMLSQVKFDFTLHLPSSAESHNADQATDENRTLYWNLAQSLTSETDSFIRVQFKIWHKEHIIITSVAAIILLILFLLLLWSSIAAKEKENGKQAKIAGSIVMGLLLIGLFSYSAYVLLSPTIFSDKDIISAHYALGDTDKDKADTSASTTTNTSVPASKPNTKEQKISAPTEKNPPAQSIPTTLPTNPLALNSIAIGDAETSIQQKMGTPDKRITKEDGRTDYMYPTMEIHCRKGSVTTLISNSSSAITPKGIHEKSSLHDVLNSYGMNYMKSQYDDLDLYEYELPAPDGSMCLLRFAINQSDQLVNYISIRHAQ